MTGRIKTLVTDRGFGFLKAADGREYFFPRTAIENDVFEHLFEGQLVSSFIEETSLRGPRASRVVVER